MYAKIVGVVRDSRYMSVIEPPSPVACYADGQRSQEADQQLVIRSSLTATATTSAITAALANTDRRIEVSYSVLSTMIGDTLLQQKLLAALSVGFGALAAILTMVGSKRVWWRIPCHAAPARSASAWLSAQPRVTWSSCS